MPRRAAAASTAPGEVDEVFTDLRGAPDSGSGLAPSLADDPADLIEELDEELTEAQRQRLKDEDEDLEVVDQDPDPEDEDQDDDADDHTGSEVTEPDPVAAPMQVGDAYDPRDIQIINAQAETLELRENTAKAAVTRAGEDIAAAKKALKAAKESGDSDAEVDATTALGRAMTAEVTANNQLADYAVQRSQLVQRAQQVVARAPKGADGKPILDKPYVPTTTQARTAGSSLFPKFRQHNAWFDKPENAGKREVLIALDKELAAEKKLDKNTSTYFDELGKRFNKIHPGVFRTLDGKPVATGTTQQRRGAAPIPNGGAGGMSQRKDGANGGKFNPKAVKLTTEDLRQMREFQMDPSNREHKKQWLASKRELAAQDAQRSAA
jgi:hypothetical protein